MIMHRKQCMGAHKIVHDFGIDPLKKPNKIPVMYV